MVTRKYWQDHREAKKLTKARDRRQGKPLVFITGCFDVFHIGHLHFLTECARLGRVHVAINTDKVIRLMKGTDRPKDTWTTRMNNVKQTGLVERIYSTGALMPFALAERINPDFVVKGLEDFMKEPSNVLLALGCYDEKGEIRPDAPRIVLIPRVANISSTSLIKESQNGEQRSQG